MIYRDIEIVRDSNIYRLSDNPITFKRLKVKSFNVSDLEREYKYETIDRLSGRFNTGVAESRRSATLVVEYDVQKIAHAIHLRNQLVNLFRDSFFIRELVATNVEVPFQKFGERDFEFPLNYASGMQLELHLISVGEYDTNRTSGEIEITFETNEIPFYESIGRSLQLEKLDASYFLWSSDMGIEMPLDSKQRKYTFENVNSGNVFYHGTQGIDQFTFDRVITITLGSDTKKFSWNLQHSEVMTIEGLNLNAGDVIKFDGLQTYRNGVSIDEYTRMSQPFFEYGYNFFTLNQKVSSIVFDMKFYYK
ncbi:phage tail family protein [Staphylococcus sp. GRT3]|uniref:Phage tail family protein n=1 Tax=Staphylococcus americanisciuri TaxID=2973940 RepID=A0ABT2F407_9STAP|nr:phage tail family protein [Staphylococcus americanisciuri]MCS4487188.1 phage tail family protein [Staphylococcus americanisciuri]